MKKFVKINIFSLALLPGFVHADAINDVMQQLQPDAFKTLKEIMVASTDGITNCSPYTPQSMADMIDTWRELVQNVTDLVREQTLELALAPNYPTICSVFSDNIANQYTDGGYSNKWTVHSPDSPSDCFLHGRCDFSTITAEALQPSYFWPKYFVETSEKGNDPHSSFASNNLLYQADRKVASQVSNLVDQAGALKLTAEVTGMSQIFDTAMSATPVPMKLGGSKLSDLMKAAALTPFEAMRIRSSKDASQPIFDSNVWPVAWSTATGKLSVCSGYINDGSQIGYTWPAGKYGAPDTCPVAMSRDAFAYWDTGMLDYVNPAAMTGMISASNPATCAASAAVTALSNLDAVQGSALGDRGAINQAVQTLGPSLSSVTGCSFPVIGDAMQIAKTAIGSVARFGGPWCSVWGSIAPRNSTLVQDSDYSFALMSQRFMFLSQELFGVPRARHERWTLAYPWEGSLNLGSNPNPSSANPADLVSNGIGGIISKIPGGSALSSLSNPVARSDTLLYPGDPRLLDTSLSSSHYAERGAEFAKDAAYIAAGMAAGPIPWTTAEIARNKFDDFRGQNSFTGNKRVYTVWDNITCKASFAKVTTSIGGVEINHQFWSVNPNGSLGTPSCKAFIHFTLYKLYQTKLLRKICDLMSKAKIIPGDQSLGAPFK